MNSKGKYFKLTYTGGKVLFIFLLVLLNLNIMTQSKYKKVKEAKGLMVGESVSDFSAVDSDGNTFKLSSALQKGPLVLIFYRGQWCPICNKHLSNLQDSLDLIYDKGANVIAVSPEKPEFLKKTISKTKASFSLLYDEDYRISNQFDVTFKPDSLTTVMYNKILGANLKKANTDDSQRLPIPATYIIDKDGKIVWRHFNPDYKKRSSVSDIVKNIP